MIGWPGFMLTEKLSNRGGVLSPTKLDVWRAAVVGIAKAGWPDVSMMSPSVREMKVVAVD